MTFFDHESSTCRKNCYLTHVCLIYDMSNTQKLLVINRNKRKEKHKYNKYKVKINLISGLWIAMGTTFIYIFRWCIYLPNLTRELKRP
jgi:hypothetical protein